MTYANVAATLALVLASGGFALAANPGDDGVIKSCVSKASHIVRVRNNAKCGSRERKLSWSQVGLSGYEIVTGETDTAEGTPLTADSTATCPEGKKAIGGGFTTSGASVSTVFSKPFSEDQWIVRTVNATSEEAYDLTAYAVCVKVSE